MGFSISLALLLYKNQQFYCTNSTKEGMILLTEAYYPLDEEHKNIILLEFADS